METIEKKKIVVLATVLNLLEFCPCSAESLLAASAELATKLFSSIFVALPLESNPYLLYTKTKKFCNKINGIV